VKLPRQVVRPTGAKDEPSIQQAEAQLQSDGAG